MTVFAGVWLMSAPAVLGHGGAAADNDRIVGPVIAAFAFVAMWPVVATLRWGVVPPGVWAVLAPVFLDYPVVAAVSSVAVGLLAVALAPIGPPPVDRFGDGWASLRASGFTARR